MEIRPFKHDVDMLVISVTLFTFGALIALLAILGDTCTQGSADTLGAGVLALILYVLGSITLIASEPRRPFLLASGPAALIACWHTLFTARFFAGYWFQNMSACAAMTENFSLENAGENMDGSEAYYTLLWLVTSFTFWFGLYRGYRASRSYDC